MNDEYFKKYNIVLADLPQLEGGTIREFSFETNGDIVYTILDSYLAALRKVQKGHKCMSINIPEEPIQFIVQWSAPHNRKIYLYSDFNRMVIDLFKEQRINSGTEFKFRLGLIVYYLKFRNDQDDNWVLDCFTPIDCVGL